MPIDFGSFSDQQFQGLIIALVVGAFFFGAVFLFSLIQYARKLGRKPIQTTLEQTATTSHWPARSMSAIESEASMADSASQRKTLLKSARVSKSTSTQPGPTPQGAGEPAVELRELLRVLVDPTTGKVIVEVEGQRYRSLKQVQDRQIGQRILEVVAFLLRFTGGLMATVQGIKSIPRPEARLSHMPPPEPTEKQDKPAVPAEPEVVADVSDLWAMSVPGATSASEADKPTESKPSDVAPPADPENTEWLEKPKPAAGDNQAAWREQPGSRAGVTSAPSPAEKSSGWSRFGFGGGKKEAAAATSAEEPLGLNLAEEIDQIVQQRLLEANESIPVRVTTASTGMVAIIVAGQRFDMVDDIEPERIRILVQEAIRTYNER